MYLTFQPRNNKYLSFRTLQYLNNARDAREEKFKTRHSLCPPGELWRVRPTHCSMEEQGVLDNPDYIRVLVHKQEKI